tara:strand:- start:5521 stop:6372 length:852 start_codon:yes stop_codon:yes gene_type:complete
MNAISGRTVSLSLDAITLDAELQPRAQIDQATYEDYANRIADGGTLPPVLVVHDGETHWLADGYHRWHAHKALGLAEIAAEVLHGSMQDAMRLSLQANAEHGKRREPGDYRRAYQIAVKYGLADETDTAAVTALLNCSVQWARELTANAREAERLARDEAIQRGRDAGKSNRQIAAETGVSRQTVDRATGGPKRNTFLMGQPEPAPTRAPPPADPVRAALDEMDSPAAQRWHKALTALREINAQASVGEMFDDPYRRFDHAFGPELEQARTWINDLHARFFHE